MSLDVSRPVTRREYPIDYISPLICDVISGQSGDVEINILPFDELNYPTGLLVEGTSIFTLTWNAVLRALCYNVYRSLGINGPYQLISTCQSSRSYSDNPGPGSWYYRVSAITPEGETPLSPPVAPTAPPPTPEPIPECSIWPTSLFQIFDLSNTSLGYSVGVVTPSIAAIQQICDVGGPVIWGTLGGSTSVAQAANKDGSSMGWASTTGDADTHATMWAIVELGETTADFVQPAVGGNVSVFVTDDSPAIGQNIRIAGGGFYEILAKPNPGELIVENLYSSNTSPTEVISSGAAVTQLQSYDTGVSQSFGIDINDTPEGIFYWLATISEYNTAIFTPGSGSTNIGVPEALASVQGTEFNNLREIAGVVYLPSLGEAVPFFWRSGIFSNILPAGGQDGAATALSKGASYVVGQYTVAATPGVQYGFISNNGASGTPMGQISAGEDVSPQAVNDSGEATGSVGIGGGLVQAFRYSGGLVPLGSLGLGSLESDGDDINNVGYICGAAFTSGTGDPVNQRAVVWKPDNTIVDLNSLLNPGDGDWFLYTAEFINDYNQVTGFGLLDGVVTNYILQLPDTI